MNTFRKEERLCSRKHLDLLFKNGSSFLLYPFRISTLVTDQTGQFPVQVVINVSKKRYKHAVDRNTVKRRIREVYRTTKQVEFYEKLALEHQLHLSIQFVGKEIYGTVFLRERFLKAIKRILANLGTDGNP